MAKEMDRMRPTASTSNLNAKLSSQREGGERSSDVGISWNATPIHSSAPPVRIVGAARPYQGGYLLNR
jgi:hypothetical protein